MTKRRTIFSFLQTKSEDGLHMGCGTPWPDNAVSGQDQKQSTDPLSPEAHPALEPLRSLHDICLRASVVTAKPRVSFLQFILCLRFNLHMHKSSVNEGQCVTLFFLTHPYISLFAYTQYIS